MSTDASTSTLLRWQPAVAALAVVAAGLSYHYVNSTRYERDQSHQGLHRSNAIRRRSPRLRHAGASIQRPDEGRIGDIDHILEDVRHERRQSFGATSLVLSDDDVVGGGAAGDGNDGQSLLNMLYHIAVEQANREGYVHRGVTCNSCNAMPIRGIRYRCANCPDYDLCEQCESLGNMHDRTHLFYKIRIPAPFLGANPRQQQPVWYPGKPWPNPRTIPNEVKKRFSEITGYDRSHIDALWEQFKTLAGADWPEDPDGLCLAIDKEIWAKYCVPPLLKEHAAPMTLLFQRSFTFYDDDGNGLVGFKEFLTGLTVKLSRDRTEKYRRTFRAHDLDSDGYVCREDFATLFTAYYIYSKELSRDMVQILEEEVLDGPQLRESLRSTQPVSSCFTGSIPPAEASRIGEGKTMTSLGDYTVTDNGGLIRPDDEGLLVENPDNQENQPAAQGVLADMFEVFAQPMADWPPEYVTAEDAQRALGKRMSLSSITGVEDQRRVLDVAQLRIEHQKQKKVGKDLDESLAVDVRNGHDRQKPALPVNGNLVGPDSGVEGVSSSDEAMQTPNSFRSEDLVQRVRPSVHQEFLYHHTREALNEMLDPMFKQIEDLFYLHERTAEERKRLRQALKEYQSKEENQALCSRWIARTLGTWRKGDTRGSMLYGEDMAQEIIDKLMSENDLASDEWMLKVLDRIYSGNISEKGIQEVLDQLAASDKDNAQALARKITHASITCSKGEQPNPEHLDELVVAPAPKRESAPSPDEEAAAFFEAAQEAGVLDGTSSVLEMLPWNDAAATNGIRDGEGQGVGHNEIPSGRSSLSDLDIFAHQNTPRQSLALTDSLDGIDAVVIQGPESEADLDVPLFVPADQPDQMDAEPTVDPTLPHNRPDVADDELGRSMASPSSFRARLSTPSYVRWSPVMQRGTIASMEQQDPHEGGDQEYFQLKLKYLTILEMVAKDADLRGGPGRINSDEFDEVMTGLKGQNLQVVGAWLDLAAF